MRTLFILAALATPAAATPTCDPDAAPGDRGPLIDHYMCQITRDGKIGDPYPCEIAAPPPKAAYDAYLRTTKWSIPCDIAGTLAKGTLDGTFYCVPQDPWIDDSALLTGKLRSIAGGFALETTAEVHHVRPVDPNDTRIPRPTIDKVEHPKLTLTVCRKPWPKGFESDVDKDARLEALHPGIDDD